MFNADKILGQLLGNPAAQGFAGGVAGGMLTSKKGRKVGKKALKYGGIAAVGALAYTAYKNHQATKTQQVGGAAPTPAAPPPPRSAADSEFIAPPADSGFAPQAGTTEANETAWLVVRSMIAAARADGQLDGQEMEKVLSHADTLDLDPESKSQLLGELRAPVDMDALVNAATTDQLKTEVYTAALLAIEVDTEVEKAYLTMLRARLGLDQGLVDAIHHQLEQEPA